MNRITDAALADATALVAGGADAYIVENFGDRPFRRATADPETVSAMTAVIVNLMREFPGFPFGINVLRNDARSALGIACSTGAAFIRVNIHIGAMVTDQGILEGTADVTLRERSRLATDCGIFADHLVKHATPISVIDPAMLARDMRSRGMADVLVVTGAATGEPADIERLRIVRDSVDAPIVLGSGLTLENACMWASLVDGAIVGTSIKQHGLIASPVDATRVRALVEAFKSS